MKVLHVIASFDPLIGGPAEGLRNIIPEIRKLGIQAEVLSLDSPVAPYISQDNFLIHALSHSNRFWRYSPKLLPWLNENLIRFDVVILHGLWLYPSYAVSKAIRLLENNQFTNKVPKLFIFPHGMLDPYFQKASTRKFKSLRNWIYWKLIESKVVNEANGILFTCKEELLLARKAFQPYQPKQELNVGYGIKQPPAFQAEMRAAFLEKCIEVNNKSYILFLSRINYKKGVDLLIKAYLALLEKNLHRKEVFPKLVIAGPGLESVYGQTIQKLVDDSQLLKNCVFFPGMLTGDSKWGAIYGCEVFALSSHQENFGIAVAEALACGKAVLISNQINIWREIEEAGCGIVAADTPEGTQSILENWLLLSVNERRSMELQARNTFEKNFHISQSVARLYKAISS